MHDVLAAAWADRPFEVWAPWSTTYTGWAAGRGDQDEVMLSARSTAGGRHGRPGDGPLFDNQHIAVVVVFVHPDHGRRGIGTALLTEVAGRARAAGRTVLMAAPYSPVDGPARAKPS